MKKLSEISNEELSRLLMATQLVKDLSSIHTISISHNWVEADVFEKKFIEAVRLLLQLLEVFSVGSVQSSEAQPETTDP